MERRLQAHCQQIADAICGVPFLCRGQAYNILGKQGKPSTIIYWRL